MANYTFQLGNFILDDQYWDAPRTDGGIIRALCSGGNFSLLWKFNADDPGYPIFDVNVRSMGRHFATLEESGFSLYEGTPVHPGKVLWRAPCPNADHGVLQDNGQLSLYDASGNLRWQSAQNITSDGVRTIHSWATVEMLSCVPPPDQPEAQVGFNGFDDKDDRNQWEMINLHADGNTYGILRNVRANMLLVARPFASALAKLDTQIQPNSLWYFFNSGHGDPQASFGLRTINCGTMGLNAAGDYPSHKSQIILYPWPSPVTLNSCWGVSEPPTK